MSIEKLEGMILSHSERICIVGDRGMGGMDWSVGTHSRCLLRGSASQLAASSLQFLFGNVLKLDARLRDFFPRLKPVKQGQSLQKWKNGPTAMEPMLLEWGESRILQSQRSAGD